MNNDVLILRSIAQLQLDKEVAVPSFRRRASVIDADRVDEPKQDPDRPADAADALALAEEAEAEAAEAEAIAAAARAKARAIRLRRQAAEAATVNAEPDAEPETETETASAAVEAEPIEAIEVDGDASDDSPAAEDEESSAAEPKRRQRGRVLKVVAAALAAVVAVACTAVLIFVSVLMFNQHRDQVANDQRRAEYSAAARQSVVTLMSLDFNTAKDDVQRIIDNATGQFKDDFKSQAEDFIKVAQDSKVITEVTVNATGVESMTDDTAVVLVSATSRVTNSAGAKQEPRSWRLSVNLRRDGGQIKMEKVEFVP
jgi:Mce-associated membrane protein